MRATPVAQPLSPAAELVHAAVESEDPSGIVEIAAQVLGGPVGLVGETGEALGHAPADTQGRRALEVAAGAGTSTVAPSGWTVVPIAHAGAELGCLAVRDSAPRGSHATLLDVIATLLGEQLMRGSLLRTQADVVVRRLLSEPGIGEERLRREAHVLGVKLADAYQPALAAWRPDQMPPAVVRRTEREARMLVKGALAVTLEDRMVLLHPEAGDALWWFEQVVTRLRATAPSSRAHAVAAEHPVPLGVLGARIAELDRLCRAAPGPAEERLVVPAREYALQRLLGQLIATTEARRFVDDRLGSLIAWDHEHRSHLLRVLEAALDFPRHDQAASRCFMHRNTFRHHLRLATRVLGDGLEDPESRLAIHVALKLRRALSTEVAA